MLVRWNFSGVVVIHRMPKIINFLKVTSYFTSFSSNLFLILNIPEDGVGDYLKYYTLSNAFFSIVVFLMFGKFFQSVDFKKISRLIGVLSFILIMIYDSDVNLVIFIYPALLIYVDYYYSQCSKMHWLYILRFFLLIDALLFYADFWGVGFYKNLNIRIFMLCVFVLMGAEIARVDKRLKINSSFKFALNNYVFYYFAMLLFVQESYVIENAKMWFLSMQVGMVYILKLHDFKLRGEANFQMPRYLYILAFFPVLILVISGNVDVLALSVFIFSACGLILNDKHIKH